MQKNNFPNKVYQVDYLFNSDSEYIMTLFDTLYKPVDYIYFRLSKAYFRWDGKSAVTALLGTSLFQVLIILSPILIIIKKIYGKSYILEHKSILSAIVIILQIITYIILQSRYKRIAESLKLKWINEKEPNKTINGVLVVFALLFPFIIIILFP